MVLVFKVALQQPLIQSFFYCQIDLSRAFQINKGAMASSARVRLGADLKKRAAEEGDDVGAEAREPKKLRGVDHDLTVIVGDKEFRHYSHSLRQASDYFDTMLSTPMKEGETMVVEFKTQEPSEWPAVHQFLDPASARAARITNRNVQMLLPWFHLLNLPNLLAECDAVIHRMLSKYDAVHAERTGTRNARLLIKDLVGQVSDSELYNLKKSFPKGIAVLKHLVENEPGLFDHVSCPYLLKVLDRSQVARESLWPSIRRKLVTKRLLSSSAEDVLDNPFSKDLLMMVLAIDGETRSRRG